MTKKKNNTRNLLGRKLDVRVLILTAAVLLFAVLVLRFAGTYMLTVYNTVLVYFIAALGMSVMFGMGGSMMFCSVSLMGVGAFVSAKLCTSYGVSTPLGLLIGVLATGLFALLIGLPLLRLNNTFFTFATLGLVQIMNNIFKNFVPLSNGPDGISKIPKLSLLGTIVENKQQWFVLLLVVGILCGLFVERIRKSAMGRALMSVRDNELMAQTMGTNIYATRVIAFTIAGLLAGLAGALLAFHNEYISYSLFTYNQSVNLVIMVMLGGINSTVGTFCGALLITLLPEWLRPLKSYLKIIYGIMLILLMTFMPTGVAGFIQSVRKKVVLMSKKRKEARCNAAG